ncbi:hypothetical protein HK101_000996 [Irineochytrium annulatum]|nr:hypothetical protein HK101_000996 [Irineochytrium annulatum]
MPPRPCQGLVVTVRILVDDGPRQVPTIENAALIIRVGDFVSFYTEFAGMDVLQQRAPGVCNETAENFSFEVLRLDAFVGSIPIRFRVPGTYYWYPHLATAMWWCTNGFEGKIVVVPAIPTTISVTAMSTQPSAPTGGATADAAMSGKDVGGISAGFSGAVAAVIGAWVVAYLRYRHGRTGAGPAASPAAASPAADPQAAASPVTAPPVAAPSVAASPVAAPSVAGRTGAGAAASPAVAPPAADPPAAAPPPAAAIDGGRDASGNDYEDLILRHGPFLNA